MATPAKLGVVLSSGGGRGVFAHTGFLMALEELGIHVEALAGCSAGALVGGVYASGTDIHHWADCLAKVRTHDYWTPDSWPMFFWNMVIRKGQGYTGFSGSEAAVEFIKSNLTAMTFEECSMPFYCLSMNLSQGCKCMFGEGDLAPRLMASAALPLLYRPVEIEGDFYSDGAVIDLTPTEAICCKHHLDILIVHHVSIHREGPAGFAHALRQPWSLVEILYLLLYRHRPWYLNDQALSFHRCPGGCGAAIVVLTPDLPELVWPLHDGGAHVQSAARSQTRKHLEPYLNLLGENPQSLAPQVAGDAPATCHGHSVTQPVTGKVGRDEGPL